MSDDFSFRWKIFVMFSFIMNLVFIITVFLPQEVGRLGGDDRMMYQIHEDIYNLKFKNEALKKAIKIYRQRESK